MIMNLGEAEGLFPGKVKIHLQVYKVFMNGLLGFIIFLLYILVEQ